MAELRTKTTLCEESPTAKDAHRFLSLTVWFQVGQVSSNKSGNNKKYSKLFNNILENHFSTNVNWERIVYFLVISYFSKTSILQ